MNQTCTANYRPPGPGATPDMQYWFPYRDLEQDARGAIRHQRLNDVLDLIERSEVHQEFVGCSLREVLIEIPWREGGPNKAVLNLNRTIVFEVDQDRMKYRGARCELEFGRGFKTASFG